MFVLENVCDLNGLKSCVAHQFDKSSNKASPIDSGLVSIWKEKDGVAKCSMYNPIKFVSHALKIFELVVVQILQGIAEITFNECRFMKMSANDASHAIRLDAKL